MATALKPTVGVERAKGKPGVEPAKSPGNPVRAFAKRAGKAAGKAAGEAAGNAAGKAAGEAAGEDGRFWLDDLDPGDETVRAREKGHIPAEDNVTVPEGAPPEYVQLMLSQVQMDLEFYTFEASWNARVGQPVVV